MKRLTIRALCINLLVFVVLFACKEPVVEESFVYPSSSFMFLQKHYNLKKGFIINYGKLKYDGGFNVNLNLISSGIEIYDKSGIIDGTSGYGHLLFFEMFSEKAFELSSGTYKFDSSYTSKPFTFDSGKGFLDMELPNKTTQTFQISGGTIEILNKKNGEYEITYDCKVISGEQVKGNYIGTLKYYDYSYLDN